MKRLLSLAVAAGVAGTALVALSPAEAAQGCGPGFHRAPFGRCVPNRGPGGRWVAHRFYQGRGYWDGNRFWWHRHHRNGGWRYY